MTKTIWAMIDESNAMMIASFESSFIMNDEYIEKAFTSQSNYKCFTTCTFKKPSYKFYESVPLIKILDTIRLKKLLEK